MDVKSLPTLNVLLDATSTFFLLLGFFAIRAKKITLHRTFMGLAFASSTIFLASYLYYHYHAGSVRFTGTGWIRPVYFAILISHTILATAIVPLIFRTLYLAWRNRFEDHRRWARWTWPLWIYVSVTGVVIYAMLYLR